jgi:hypothetical protein
MPHTALLRLLLKGYVPLLQSVQVTARKHAGRTQFDWSPAAFPALLLLPITLLGGHIPARLLLNRHMPLLAWQVHERANIVPASILSRLPERMACQTASQPSHHTRANACHMIASMRQKKLDHRKLNDWALSGGGVFFPPEICKAMQMTDWVEENSHSMYACHTSNTPLEFGCCSNAELSPECVSATACAAVDICAI